MPFSVYLGMLWANVDRSPSFETEPLSRPSASAPEEAPVSSSSITQAQRSLEQIRRSLGLLDLESYSQNLVNGWRRPSTYVVRK